MPTSSNQNGIKSVAVIGAGVMGHGIAISFAKSGRSVKLYDINQEILDDAERKIQSIVDMFASEGEITETESKDILQRISYTTSLKEASDNVDFITEAVVEDIDIKQEVFEKLERHTAPDTILATNSSGLSITEIASVTNSPSRVVGTHWFNPPYLVPLVEIIYGESTSDSTVERTYEMFDQLEKEPVIVKKDIPGYIGNRIQMAMAYEAFSLLEKGVATAEDIDRAISAGFGFRLPVLGIFEKVDHSGVDVHYDVESYLMEELDRGTKPNPTVTELVQQNDLGVKTGSGIYNWENDDPEEVYKSRDRRLLSLYQTYMEEYK